MLKLNSQSDINVLKSTFYKAVIVNMVFCLLALVILRFLSIPSNIPLIVVGVITFLCIVVEILIWSLIMIKYSRYKKELKKVEDSIK